MEVVVGTIVLLLAKFFVYTGYFAWLGRIAKVSRNSYLLAFARIVLGLAFGAIVWGLLSSARDQFLPMYFVAIGIGRLLAWAIVIGAAFPSLGAPRGVAAALGGVLLSYAVEIPIALGFIVAIGGIC